MKSVTVEWSFINVTEFNTNDLEEIVSSAKAAGVKKITINQYRSTGDYGGTDISTYFSYEEKS